MIPGTDNVLEAAFSPDGDWIVFATTDGAILKVSLLGGAPTPVVPSGLVTRPRGPHWGGDGTIVFSGPTGIHLVPETGGEPVPLGPGNVQTPTSLSFLPGGGAVLLASGDRVMLLDLEADSVRELVSGGFDPQYVETGHILYADASGRLWALPFDAARAEVLGRPIPILDRLSIFPIAGRGYARYSVSRNGTLVYGTGGGAGGGVVRQLLIVDLEGSVEEPPLDRRNFRDHRWSPNGRSVVYASVEGGDDDPDIFTYDVALGTTPRQLTFEGFNLNPVWSPDGSRIAFRSTREGTQGSDLFVKNVNDNSPPEAILSLPGQQSPTHWPSDDVLIFENGAPPDLWIADLSSDSAVAREYLSSEEALSSLRISPSGDLAAYAESIPPEVYVRGFPEPGARERVSQGGGRFPFWSADGNTIYYWTVGRVGSDVALMAARVQRGPPFVVTGTDSILHGPYQPRDWALHPDGDRIVVTQDVTPASEEAQGEGGADPERFLVVVNWFTELRERMGEN